MWTQELNIKIKGQLIALPNISGINTINLLRNCQKVNAIPSKSQYLVFFLARSMFAAIIIGDGWASRVVLVPFHGLYKHDNCDNENNYVHSPDANKGIYKSEHWWSTNSCLDCSSFPITFEEPWHLCCLILLVQAFGTNNL